MNRVQFLYKAIKPKSTDEDLKRQEFILNIILSISILLSGTTVLHRVYRIHFDKGEFSTPTTLLFIVFGIFLVLYLLSRRGFIHSSSYFLILVYLTPTLLTAYRFGVDLPQVLLTLAFLIIIAGILISTRFSFILTALISGILLLITYLTQIGTISPNYYWTQAGGAEIPDMIVVALTFFVISSISWLSNREIEKSLIRARKSEAELKTERDNLELTVEKRTAELKEAQRKRVSQLTRFAEFGKQASGIYHDLINPLTALSLNIESIKTEQEQLKQTKTNLEQASKAAQRMESFLKTVRSQLREDSEKELFSVNEAIEETMTLFEHRAKKERISLEFYAEEPISLYGSSVKFHQVITNLLANAMDAYTEIDRERKNRRVKITLAQKKNELELFVQDWATGIAKEQVDKIFEPFYTTKQSAQGVGIGLASVQSIIEQEFSGTISVQSEKERWTTFTIVLPLTTNPS